MKILVLGTIDNKGGAAQVSWELRKRLKAADHIVSTFVRYKYSNEPDVFVIPRKRWQDWLVKLFANDLRFARTGYLFNTKEYREADIIHCHNLHSNFFNLRDLIRMSREKPVVWTMHDLWAITGFASDSVTLRNPNKKRFLLWLWDRTPALLRAKKRIYDRSRLNVVAVSGWLRHKVEKSVLARQQLSLIYNGVDTSVFRPHDRTSARRELSLPLDKKIVGLGMKEWASSAALVDLCRDKSEVYFVSIGRRDVRDRPNLKAMGYIDDPKRLALALSALDVFFYPTQGDTFGLGPVEAMSCGVPVVTFATDAMPEIVAHGETGYVVEQNDIRGALAAVDRILSLTDEDTKALSGRARERVERLFDVERMYAEYLALYEKLLDNARNLVK